MTQTTLLIDGDLFAYQLSAGSERTVDFGEGNQVTHAYEEVATANIDGIIAGYIAALNPDAVVIALSDTVNYRKTVMPSYKSNRDDVVRPMVLAAVKQHLADNYTTVIVPTLEADDVLGIMATNPKMYPGYKIVITEDKDLRSVPGFHWNPKKEGAEGKPPTEITLAEADHNFYCQVLSGDPVDGYSGCPGIGKMRAAGVVTLPVLKVPKTRLLKSGKNKGTEVHYFEFEETDDLWAAIVSHYEAEGLTEADALRAARVARILRYEDYDFKKKEPILWTPQ